MSYDPTLVPTVPVQSFTDECAAEALSRGCAMYNFGAITGEVATFWFTVADIRTPHGLLLVGHVTDAPGFAPERCANIRKYFPPKATDADTR